jgi:hypothetical protein
MRLLDTRAIEYSPWKVMMEGENCYASRLWRLLCVDNSHIALTGTHSGLLYCVTPYSSSQPSGWAKIKILKGCGGRSPPWVQAVCRKEAIAKRYTRAQPQSTLWWRRGLEELETGSIYEASGDDHRQ